MIVVLKNGESCVDKGKACILKELEEDGTQAFDKAGKKYKPLGQMDAEARKKIKEQKTKKEFVKTLCKLFADKAKFINEMLKKKQ